MIRVNGMITVCKINTLDIVFNNSYSIATSTQNVWNKTENFFVLILSIEGQTALLLWLLIFCFKVQ